MEYPSALDISDILPESKDEGAKYLVFLTILKKLFPGKYVSIAALASDWYLKGLIPYPADQQCRGLHCIYDLRSSRPVGRCQQMVTAWVPIGKISPQRRQPDRDEELPGFDQKAGVPSNKVVVDITSYGRSFEMVKAGFRSELPLHRDPHALESEKGQMRRYDRLHRQPRDPRDAQQHKPSQGALRGCDQQQQHLGLRQHAVSRLHEPRDQGSSCAQLQFK